MVDALWGYIVFGVGMLGLIALLTVAVAWWLRWVLRRVFLWTPHEKKPR